MQWEYIKTQSYEASTVKVTGKSSIKHPPYWYYGTKLLLTALKQIRMCF